MDVERQRRVLELLDEALARSVEERPAFLDEACGDDPEMRREVEALLGTGPGGGLFAEPAFSVHAEDAAVGRRIGPYQLIELLDRGGMGSVYLAEREDLEKRVALKVIRRGLDADDVMLRRFHNERQILARLEHPHIARFLDGGATEDRLPYFVMEYAEGVPIDRYCQARGLSVEARLDLFRKVCSAVQFAHQNLVIHRDLKPGNIFINAEGEPKLLDFGIAKLLDEGLAAETLLTEPGQGPMTPRYASPEQIRLEPVTTASDVYSLGVLLYELLTGIDPYGVESGRSDEVARAICEKEPERPSTAVRRRAADGGDTQALRRRLAGDLDTIVLKAMRKEPGQRYHSVEQLSDDIRRHLQGRPIEAQTGTFTYRAGKFVRRHKLAMAIAAVFLLVSLGFSIVATALWRQAVQERKRAETVSQFLKDLFQASDPDYAGTLSPSAPDLLNRGRVILSESLKEEPELRIAVAGSLGKIFRARGANDDAREMMELSLAAAREHHGGDHSEVVKRINNLGVLLYGHQDNAEAEPLLREAWQMGGRLRLPDRDLLRIQGNLAACLLRQGKLEQAEDAYLDVLRKREELYADEPDDKDVATSRRSLASVYFAQGRYDEAEPLLRKALEARSRVHGPEHTSVASVLDLLGSVVAGQGREQEAEELYRKALDVRLQRLEHDHGDIAKTRKNLAALLARRDPAAARELVDQALETLRRDLPKGWEVAEAESVLGEILAAERRYGEAESYLVKGFEKLRERRGADDFRTRAAFERMRALYEDWGKPEKLEPYRALRAPP